MPRRVEVNIPPIVVNVNVRLSQLDRIEAKLDDLTTQVQAQGVEMSELTDAVTAMKERVDADVAHLQDVIADLTAQLVTALGNDAADAATIAAKQAELDTLNAEVASTVESLNAIDPVSNFPEPTP